MMKRERLNSEGANYASYLPPSGDFQRGGGNLFSLQEIQSAPFDDLNYVKEEDSARKNLKGEGIS